MIERHFRSSPGSGGGGHQVVAAPPELATTKIRIAQPRIVVISVAIY